MYSNAHIEKRIKKVLTSLKRRLKRMNKKYEYDDVELVDDEMNLKSIDECDIEED